MGNLNGLFLDLGDVLGRVLGEPTEAVAAAESDHEFLAGINILVLKDALLVVGTLELGHVLGRRF